MSLLTTLYPEGFDFVTGRSDMICDMYAICGKLFVICELCMLCGPEGNMLWAGRRLCYGPEGVVLRTGRSGPGKAYVRKCILGNSLSIYAYSCLCMCFRY